jgi:hypothetical protein
MQKKILALAAFTLLFTSNHLLAQSHKYDDWEFNYTVQALLGAVKYDDLDIDVDESNDRKSADLSVIPQLGGAWGTLPKGDRIQIGLETTFLFGFRSKDVDYIVISSGLRARISTDLWIIDFAGGPYINIFLDEGKKFRLYAGAGPLLMYADYDADDDREIELPDDINEDTNDDNESAFGFGVYARTGFEFRVHERGTLGMGIRANYVELDLSDVGGTSDMTGFAGFVTYTAGF